MRDESLVSVVHDVLLDGYPEAPFHPPTLFPELGNVCLREQTPAPGTGSTRPFGLPLPDSISTRSGTTRASGILWMGSPHAVRTSCSNRISCITGILSVRRAWRP